MSDTSTPEPVVPATTPAEPVAVTESAAEPARVAEPAPVVETEAVAEPAPVVETEPVVEKKKKRGVGAWSFVLGLLTALSDLAFLIFGIVLLVGTISSLASGDFSGVVATLGATGLALVALFLFFGGFLTGGVAALLGLIALISGRGRVLGFFGLLFGVAAIAVRLLLLSSGDFTPSLG